MRFILLLAIAASTSIAALGGGSSDRPMRVSQNVCELDAYFTAVTTNFVKGFLTDTGELGERFAVRRQEFGVVGVRYDQVVMVQDTLKCRAALNSFKALYASFSSELGAEAARVEGIRLFRLTPNRFIVGVPMLNKYSGLTYLAVDSNGVVVRKNL